LHWRGFCFAGAHDASPHAAAAISLVKWAVFRCRADRPVRRPRESAGSIRTPAASDRATAFAA